MRHIANMVRGCQYLFMVLRYESVFKRDVACSMGGIRRWGRIRKRIARRFDVEVLAVCTDAVQTYSFL